MPLMQYHLIKGRTPEEIELFLDTAHDAMVRTFKVPEGDRYQTLTEYEPSHLKALDTGLGIPRTRNFVLLHVVSRPRGKEAKQEFYKNLCDDLLAKCGIAATDVMISFTENTDEDWSFGNGRAQFLSGEL